MNRRKKKLAEEVVVFLQQYARKKRGNGWDPNDRHYSRHIEQMVKRMRPEEFDELLNGAEDDDTPASPKH